MTQSPTAAATLHRRDVLKLGLGGAALLSAGAMTASLAGCSANTPPATGYGFLREADLVLYTALIPAVLGSALPTAGREALIVQILKGVDATAIRLSPPTQKALYQLFDLLNTGLTRRVAARVKQPWSETTPAQAKDFLDRWENSTVGLFNAGYRGLVRSITGAWAGTDAGLKTAGYPGPLPMMFDAIHAA